MAMSIYGEERERKQFVAAVKDGYVLSLLPASSQYKSAANAAFCAF